MHTLKKLVIASVLAAVFSVCGSSATVQAAETSSRAVFTGEVASQTDLFILDLATLKSSPLTTVPSNESQAAVSPDGKSIAFISDRSGAPSLYLLDLNSPAVASWTELGLEMGVYQNPAFSPDGKFIAAGYAPDPESPYSKTRLVSIDIAARTQKVILDTVAWRPNAPGEAGAIVVDRPVWFDASTLIFVEIEYGSLDPIRIVSSTLHRLSLPDGKTQRLVGGEAGYDAEGRSKSFRVSMPARFSSAISFAAIRGPVDRLPMSIEPDGKQRKPVTGVTDPDFFGPILKTPNGYLYTWQDGDSLLHLATWDEKKGRRIPIPFTGSAREPALIP
ncbi:MAG: hypothetical protein WA705_25545 [Candidatus Ozemobacteraceae bacterium]